MGVEPTFVKKNITGGFTIVSSGANSCISYFRLYARRLRSKKCALRSMLEVTLFSLPVSRSLISSFAL